MCELVLGIHTSWSYYVHILLEVVCHFVQYIIHFVYRHHFVYYCTPSRVDLLVDVAYSLYFVQHRIV